jgi:hypothetical protein
MTSSVSSSCCSMTLKQGPLLAPAIFTVFLLSPLKAGLSPLIISHVI